MNFQTVNMMVVPPTNLNAMIFVADILAGLLLVGLLLYSVGFWINFFWKLARVFVRKG